MTKLFFFAVTAVTSAGLYSGAAVYMSLVQHPVIMRLRSRRLQAPFFCHMYVSASAFLAPIGLLASAASFAAGMADTAMTTTNNPSASALWVVGGAIFLALVPYTALTMLPLNLHLTNEQYWKSHRTSVMQAKLSKWGFLHAVRSVASVIGTATLICACLR
ncbi:hypothetical protein H257_10586 [Aphanomyces astaci]|uniref:DUF1772 domain-containing protein n=1 Tax=Aphanomyces astaci TaxID=112090 RepID=W4G6R9_APHAT|nr:hypothetical protein H257_10586 [Aphanomyces astaci]ETV74981.1 hypothetical protein H257_10586 [Aphanomyces astaci]RQM29626.1 hypothetical protein B5M09_010316 [Aphanomyces astaci]|eukprot:XP_009835485.1 hypothetical protein H257_10586 [Aphanomyces astaci]